MPAVNPDAAELPTVRQWHWVGDINLGARNDGYVGAKCKTFYTVRAFNKYFSDNKRKLEDGSDLGMLLIQVLSCRPILFGLLGTVIVCLVTNQLDPEEMAEMTSASREVEEHMNTWRKQRDAIKAEEREVKVRAEEEVRRLARLGDHCEKNHKHNGKE